MLMAMTSKLTRPSMAGRSSWRASVTVPISTPRMQRAVGAAPAGGATPQPTVPEVYTNDSVDPEIVAFQQHQKTAARPSVFDEARTMVSLARFGLMSTVATREEMQGLPNGSVVEYATDVDGHPVFAVSTLSSHCADLKEDGRVSLTVLQPGFQSIADRRFTIQGNARPVSDGEKVALREAYLAKYTDAFYVDFADFRWFVLDDIKGCRYYGGFGAAKKISSSEYTSSTVDPVAAFSAPVCAHMNDDKNHVKDMQAVISQVVGLTTDDAKMIDLDRLGMNFMVKRKGESFTLRLPFPEPAENRKAIKEQIVGMVKALAKED